MERPADEQLDTDGVDHLQVAALEMIDAARSFLDVVEQFISDRDRVADVVDAIGVVAQAAASGISDATSRVDRGADRPTTRSEPVQRIPVS